MLHRGDERGLLAILSIRLIRQRQPFVTHKLIEFAAISDGKLCLMHMSVARACARKRERNKNALQSNLKSKTKQQNTGTLCTNLIRRRHQFYIIFFACVCLFKRMSIRFLSLFLRYESAMVKMLLMMVVVMTVVVVEEALFMQYEFSLL